jgi:hypothetical protein
LPPGFNFNEIIQAFGGGGGGNGGGIFGGG